MASAGEVKRNERIWKIMKKKAKQINNGSESETGIWNKNYGILINDNLEEQRDMKISRRPIIIKASSISNLKIDAYQK